MKNIIIFSMLAVMVVINFSGCGKAQERPSKPNKKIESQLIAIDGLVDITKAEDQNTEANITFMKQLISKLDSSDKRIYAEGLLAQNRLVFMLTNEKVLLLEFLAAEDYKQITETLKITSEKIEDAKYYNLDALVSMKTGQDQEWSKASTASQNRFAILAKIAIQSGILENETTDYNEKKSTLKLTETSLDQAQFIILKSEIKDMN